MIGKLTGKIEILSDDSILIETSGVGYLVYTSTNTISKLENNITSSLFIETHVREDSIQLFGFLNMEEKDCFLKLNSVSGVGVRVALSILSSLAPSEIAGAIASKNKEAFRSISGIGPKLAERILLELKDKSFNYGELKISGSNGNMNLITDAVSALINLGINRNDAYSNVQNIVKSNPNIDINNLIREALKIRKN